MSNSSVDVGADFPLESGWNPADWELIRASVATLVLATKSPLNRRCARWSEGSLFGHWRSGMEFTQVSYRSTRRGGQGAPSTIRCIEARSCCPGASWAWCQGGRRPTSIAVAPRTGAPSALLRSSSAVRCAHKGPELGNAVRTQGRNQAVVCDVVLRKPVPCVRNRELRVKEGVQRHQMH